MLLEVSEPFSDGAKAGSSLSPNGVSAPTKIPEGDVSVGEVRGQQGFDISVALLTLNKRAAQQDNAVAIF